MREYITKPVFDDWANEVAIPELMAQACYTIKTEDAGKNEWGFPCVRLVLTVEEGDDRLLHDTCETLDQLEVTEL